MSERQFYIETKSQFKRFCESAISFVAIMLAAVVCAMLITSYVISPVMVDGTSMTPTLLDGQMVWVLKAHGAVTYDDIIIFLHCRPEDEGKENAERVEYIKRVVGKPGDVMSIDKNANGVRCVFRTEPTGKKTEVAFDFHGQLHENIAAYHQQNGVTEYTVPEDRLFVMGDNWGNSHDSTEFGAIERELVDGKALFIKDKRAFR